MRKIYCDIRKCMSCRSCEIACAVRHSSSGSLLRALFEEPLPRHLVKIDPTKIGSSPTRCHHCEDAPCIDACKRGGIYRDPSGKVLIDANKCVGCRRCVTVCPFGAIFLDKKRKKAIKCDLCEGYESPACVSACPTGALYWTEFSEFEQNYKRAEKYFSPKV